MNRRSFLSSAAAASAGLAGLGALASCERKPGGGAPAVVTGQAGLEWKMATAWPPRYPLLGEAAERIAASVERMSGGRLKIRVFGGGELVPPLGVFDAVSAGQAEMGHGAAAYWAAKLPAAQLFTTAPFGMSAQQMNGWLLAGGGLELWRELYAPHKVVPFVAGNTGLRMGGWFRKEIRSLQDLKGLKMRVPGLGGKVIARLGATPIALPAEEIYQALEKGVIDATEWIGPYHDLKMGLYQAAPYYYYPGWNEPAPAIECTVNAEKWAALSPELQGMLETAIAEAGAWTLAQFGARNGSALQELVVEHRVKLKQFPDAVLRELKRVSAVVLQELAAGDPAARRVYESWLGYQAQVDPWLEVSARAYQHARTL